MKMKRGALGLELPVKEPGKKPPLEMTPEAVMRWRAGLPMADTGETAKEIYLTLRHINLIDIDPLLRLKILDLFWPPLQMICQSLRKHYIAQSTELTRQKLTIVNLAQTLQHNMALGYKIVIEELHQDKSLDPGHRLMVFSIIYTMHYLTKIYARCNHMFFWPVENLWRELNILYTYSEEHKLTEVKLRPDEIRHKGVLDIITAYKIALLIGSSNPYQWRQRDQDALNDAIPIWTQYLEIRPPSHDDEKKPSLFIIDTRHDSFPIPLSLGRVEVTKTCKVIDVSKIVDHVAPILRELKKDELKARMKHDLDPDYGISCATLETLVNNWRGRIIRGHSRFPIQGKMHLTFGLSATHYYSSGMKKFNPQDYQIITDKEDEDASLGSELPTLEFIDMGTGEIASKAPLSHSQEEFHAYDFDLVDISSAGACASWEQSNYPPVQAGEIVGLCSSATLTADSIWSIGVVRWLLHTDDQSNKLKIGIKLLAPYATPVAIQLIKDGQPSGYFLRSLILPAMENLGIRETLITTTLPFKEKKTVLIRRNDSEEVISAELSKQTDATGSYRQFEFLTRQTFELDKIDAPSALEEHLRSNQQDLEDNLEDHQFDNIWDRL